MLWLKAWLETRWKVVWILLIGVLVFGLSIGSLGKIPKSDTQGLLSAVLTMSAFVAFLAAVMLAGSGIETASTRPSESLKGGEGSTLFTLSLPVSRARLFSVRTATGVLETVGVLALFGVAAWLLLPLGAANARDVLASLAVIVSFGVTLYSISACLSTFCDEGWRIRLSSLTVAGLFALFVGHKLPRFIDIFGALVSSSPLITHHVPWAMIISTCAVTVLFLATGMVIIQMRDY